MVCSVSDRSGGSTIAMNLSVLMARGMYPSCLLVEANLLSPTLHRYKKGKPCNGLCQLLEEQGPFENYILPTNEPRLFAMGAGVSEADGNGQIFHPSRLDNVLSGLTSAYHIVIIDGPPVLQAGQSLQLARYVDGVMLIVRNGELAENLRNATALLEDQQARVLGLVMNG